MRSDHGHGHRARAGPPTVSCAATSFAQPGWHRSRRIEWQPDRSPTTSAVRRGTGIEIGALSFGNHVLTNAASVNGADGIHVADTAPIGQGNIIESNTADGNGGDGITVEGAGHILDDNSAQLNGGWGIYARGRRRRRGGNLAAGNVEPAQCLGVVCTVGAVPGAPETVIVERPPLPSHSRNATFTYIGSDSTTALIDMLWECRLDSTSDLDWVECEYPAGLPQPEPRSAHASRYRAVDSGLLADPTPASYTWTYEPLPANVGPTTVIDLKPELITWVPEALFTFHAEEPDVLFECRVDVNPFVPCSFDSVPPMNSGAYVYEFVETEAGPHTFEVRAIDFEGNVGDPATYTWSLLGIATEFLDGPGFTPGIPPEPNTGGPTLSTTATIDFQANVADATFECSLDLTPFVPCSAPATFADLTVGGHELRVIATDSNGISEVEPAAFEWEVLDSLDTVPPATTIERVPVAGSSATLFEFTGTDNLTPTELVTFECRVDSTNALDWFACVSPFNLLDVFTYQDPQLAPGSHTFEVRAVDTAEAARSLGADRRQRRSDAGHLHLDDDSRHHGTGHRSAVRPR